MKKLEGDVKDILDLAGSVIADKGFQGSGYVTPDKKPQDRELYASEHEYNNQVSSIRAPIERSVAHLRPGKFSSPITGGRSERSSTPFAQLSASTSSN